MKIVSVDIIDVKNPLQSAVAKWRPVVVRINTDEGVSGFGEVGMAYGVGASAGFGMAKDLARLLIGEDPMRSEYIWDKMQKKTFWGQGGGTVVSAGMSAIDIALWDIKGKVLGVRSRGLGDVSKRQHVCEPAAVRLGQCGKKGNSYDARTVCESG